jgi:hypothetical protein
LFVEKWCPKCRGPVSQTFRFIKGLIKFLIIPVIVIAIMTCAAPSLSERIMYGTVSAVDITTLYAYSKDAYFESIIHGGKGLQYYTTKAELPYYSSIVSHEQLEGKEPLGILPKGVLVQLRSEIRRGGDVWIPAFFYVQEKPYQAFVLFPRDWEANVTLFEGWDDKVTGIKGVYTKYIDTHFEVLKWTEAEERANKEKYNDYFKVKGIGPAQVYYAPKTDKAQIDRIYAYYMNPNSISMVLLQTDKEWVRPEFSLNNKTEEDK